jgi:integrase
MKEIVWDTKLPGFGLRTRNGKRTWIFQYKLGKQNRRIKLGGPELTRDKARQLAQAEKGKLAAAKLGHGLDPAAEREKRRTEAKPHRAAFASIIPIYLDARRAGIKDATYELQERYLNSHWKALHGLPLDGITRADVAASLTTIAKGNGPVAANRARSTLSKFYVWAIGEGLCDNNPVVGTNKRDENDPRERSLSNAETAAVWLGAADSDYGRILKLLLLTGCRRSEIGDLKWSELDTEARTITLPRERTKNHQQHIVPLSDAAMSILASIKHRDRDYVFGRTRAGGFSGWSKSKDDFDKVVKLKEPWTVHDLRRTVRTGLGELGIQPHIAEAVLNHIPPKLIRTYDRNKYESEKRAALDQWATHLKSVVAQATGANVTALRNPRR